MARKKHTLSDWEIAAIAEALKARKDVYHQPSVNDLLDKLDHAVEITITLSDKDNA